MLKRVSTTYTTPDPAQTPAPSDPTTSPSQSAPSAPTAPRPSEQSASTASSPAPSSKPTTATPSKSKSPISSKTRARACTGTASCRPGRTIWTVCLESRSALLRPARAWFILSGRSFMGLLGTIRIIRRSMLGARWGRLLFMGRRIRCRISTLVSMEVTSLQCLIMLISSCRSCDVVGLVSQRLHD
jgi:hypothetical protein